jgi:beta-lactamase superfamily II metal-dependent hydrolase
MTGQIQFEFLNAAHGDSIVVSWDDPPKLALIDGGPTGKWDRALIPRLQQLRAERGTGLDQQLTIDLICVSHIDDDHIAGIVRILRDLRQSRKASLPEPNRVKRLWHNSFEELVAAGPASIPLADVESETSAMLPGSAVVAASVNQGRDLRDLARFFQVDGNHPFNGPIVGGLSTTVDGLEVSVVAPDSKALADLEEEWRKAKQQDNPGVLAAAFDDRRVPNLSSICTVIGRSSARALLTADARGDRVMDGLEQLGLLPVGGKVHFDIVQVPHHGSENNSAPAFFERVTADHYVISADGIAHAHPSPSTLEWIVDSRGADAFTIHLTNPIEAALTKLEDLKAGKNFTVEKREDPALGVTLTLE